MSKSTVFTPEVLAVKCRACSAEPGQPCVVGATGAKATKAHNVRVADGRENAASLFTPDVETADEFSEYEDDLLGDPEATTPTAPSSYKAVTEATEAAEPITWTEYPAKDIQPGMIIEHKGRPARVAGRRVTAKWVTALDEDLSTLLYVAPDSVVRVWL